MKIFIISLACVLLMNGIALADTSSKAFQSAVFLYKNGNYTGCIDSMTKIIKNDPGNALAHYYLAISFTQIGDSEKATMEYKTVLSLAPNHQLESYAQKGLKNLENVGSLIKSENYLENKHEDNYPKDDKYNAPYDSKNNYELDKMFQNLPDQNPIMPAVPKSNQMMHPAGKNNQSLEQKDEHPNSASNKYIAETDQNDDADIASKQSANSSVSQEDIKKAIQVLSKAGAAGQTVNQDTNQYANQALSQMYNPEMMQMNMLMNSLGSMQGGNNNNMNMLPLMMMYQNQNGNQKIDPQLMQTILQSSMMPGMNMMLNTGNNNND